MSVLRYSWPLMRRNSPIRAVLFACIALAAILPGMTGTALSQSAKPPEVKTVGPPVALSAEQARAIAEKLARTNTARPLIQPPSKTAELSLPAGRAQAATSAARSDAAVLAARAVARAKRWPDVSPRIGSIPRAAWSIPWYERKPADVTISRPAPARGPSPNSVAWPGPSSSGSHRTQRGQP